MTPVRAWTPTSGPRTTSSATSTDGGSTRRTSPPTARAGGRSCSWPTRPSSTCTRSSRSSRPRVGTTPDSTKIADLYHSFMDEESVEAKGSKPIRPVLEAAADLRDVRDLAAFLGDFEKNGGGGLFASYVDNDDRDAERNIVYVRQGGLGLPDETYYRDDKFAEKREKYVEHLERMFGLVGHEDAGRRRRDRAARRDPARRGPLGAGRDPRRHQDLQPQDAGRAEGPLPGLRLGRLDPQPRRQPRHPGRGLRPAAVVPRAPLGRAHRDAHRGLADLDGREGRPRRRAVPLRARSSRRTSTSTAAPWAVRRSCGPAGSAASRWSRARSARPSAASTPSGTSRRAPRR